jgi:hypothetical protein
VVDVSAEKVLNSKIVILSSRSERRENRNDTVPAP